MIGLRIWQAILYLPFLILFPTKIVGKKNLPKGRAVLSCNHKSNLDAILFALNTWESKRYLAKKELFDNKLVGAVIKSVGAIKIDRNGNDIAAIKQCMKILKSEKKLVIYPEGTRNKNDNMELGQIKHGVAMFAIKTQSPVVPMYISRKPKMFHRTVITVGQPFTLEQFYGKRLEGDIMEEASAIVASAMENLRENCIKTLTSKKKSAKMVQ